MLQARHSGLSQDGHTTKTGIRAVKATSVLPAVSLGQRLMWVGGWIDDVEMPHPFATALNYVQQRVGS